MESNLLEKPNFYDINWYFTDKYNRLCVVASGGGLLPKFLYEEKSKNDEFHEVALELENRFDGGRNKNVITSIVDLDQHENLEQYFSDFDSLAKKGFFVYDKVNLNFHDDPMYVLVAYPLYNTKVNTYPIDPNYLELIPFVDKPLISRNNDFFSDSNFVPQDLLSFVDANFKWRF